MTASRIRTAARIRTMTTTGFWTSTTRVRTIPRPTTASEDDDGCPDRGSVVIEENQIVILEKIYFEDRQR